MYEGRTYQLCVVPFDLNILNTALGQALKAILSVFVNNGDNISTDLHIYVNDLLMFSTSFYCYLFRLQILFRKIRISSLTLKLSKCEFFDRRSNFVVM